jgi:hypothetical protein
VLWAICAVLLLIWALGLATSYTAGGNSHPIGHCGGGDCISPPPGAKHRLVHRLGSGLLIAVTGAERKCL